MTTARAAIAAVVVTAALLPAASAPAVAATKYAGAPQRLKAYVMADVFPLAVRGL